jgi:hypothetical protein
LIRKELQSLLREPQTRAILIMPVLIQVLLFPWPIQQRRAALRLPGLGGSANRIIDVG